MAEQTDFIIVEGERRPTHKPSDEYLMAAVWFGGPGSTGGFVRFHCDSHYGLGRLCEALDAIANQESKKFTVDLLATEELIAFVEADPSADNCIPTLAKKLVLFASDEPNLFNFEYDGKQTLEMYVGVKAAASFSEDFCSALGDAYTRGRELWPTDRSHVVGEPPHNQNALASMFDIWVAWPGLHKTPKNALQYQRNNLYFKYNPGECDTAEAIEFHD